MSFAPLPNTARRNNTTRRALIPQDNPTNTLVSTASGVPLPLPPGTSGGVRRKKSRSPSARPRADFSAITTALGKKRKSTAPSSSGSGNFLFSARQDDMPVDRGRTPKLKSKTQSRHALENSSAMAVTSQQQALGSRPSKKERSKSRESKERARKHTSEVDSDKEMVEPGGRNSQTVALSAELSKIKKELEVAKRQAHENKRTISKQSKVIDELRQKLTAGDKAMKENESQLVKLKTKSKKADDTIASIEGHINCQICMEVLLKPFVLSPCGHVLCQGCLQEWFRKAPASEDDMYESDDPDYLVYRLKSCPCCRANVRERPLPLFILKGIAAAILKSKSVPHVSPPPEGDPWEGLFPPVGEDFGEDDDEDGLEDDDDDEDEEDEEDEEDYNEWLTSVFAYGSDSDEEPYEGEYVSPQWEPPSVTIDPAEYEYEDLSPGDLSVLRRGATLDMLDTFNMTYAHAEGLVAHLEEEKVHLGWNIRLSADDETGEDFIEYLYNDMNDRPERWDIMEAENGTKICHRLIPEDELEEHDTTDSELWVDNNDVD
ncbi:hypothetical protein FIBSPDRAFT_814735 [Athelia psychrophila]|uniref:RING-type domain-containing protein n=1 Tax=Athelia psychrophila TaxID=1759441 RepID=A0A166TCB3_9AGAM|nr:hypothetical protein FIBSPDRAFT_814735 [Fibularhizoctonia sp. CBS 109695]